MANMLGLAKPNKRLISTHDGLLETIVEQTNKVLTPWFTDLFLHCQHNRVIVACEVNLELLQQAMATDQNIC
jgi:hypothetical protein